jgi:hypothetical protein
MKAYLITTGSIYGLLAAMHVWRAIAERQMLNDNPGQFAGLAVLGMIATALSLWSWVLLRTRTRP